MPHTISTEMLSAWLRLSMTPGLGPVSCQRLLSHFPDPLAIVNSPSQQLATLVPNALYESLLFTRGEAVNRQIDSALKWAEENDHVILTPDQSLYPAMLLQMHDAPIVLFAKGELSRLTHPALAIVGARNASPDGLDHATDFAATLAQQSWCVVSGLAQGIDAAAHRGALQVGREGGGTIAVFGTGVDVTYPRNHVELVRRVLSAGGLIISEFGLGTPARPHHFPRRNRIVAGLSKGVLVVEAALKSGSLLTARLAVEMDREVFAIPGSIHSPLSRGPHSLIRQGATLVESADDILNELDMYRLRASGSAYEKTPICAPGTSQRSPVWDAIGYDPVNEDILQQRTNMLPALLQYELLTLELNGDIERRPNGLIVRARKCL